MLTTDNCAQFLWHHVQHFGLDGDNEAKSPAEYAAFINDHRPHVVCLQEVDKGRTCKSKSVDQDGDICTALEKDFGSRFGKKFYGVRELKRNNQPSYEKVWGKP